MTLPAMHGWTHRPKALGGTDPIEISSTLPVAYADSNNGGTLANGTNYMIPQLASATYDEDGLAEKIVFANDPGDGSKVFWAGDAEDRVMVYNGAWVVQVEAGITIPFGQHWTGEITIFVDDTTGTISPPNTPTFNNGLIERVSQTSRNADYTVRLGGTVIIDVLDFTDADGPFDQPFEVKVRQETGGDLDWGECWTILTVLTPLNITEQYP